MILYIFDRFLRCDTPWQPNLLIEHSTLCSRCSFTYNILMYVWFAVQIYNDGIRQKHSDRIQITANQERKPMANMECPGYKSSSSSSNLVPITKPTSSMSSWPSGIFCSVKSSVLSPENSFSWIRKSLHMDLTFVKLACCSHNPTMNISIRTLNLKLK